MSRDSLINLDPISNVRKRQDSLFGRLVKTRYFRGKKLNGSTEFGHYLFCGKQGSSKTVSCLWYTEYLIKKWTKLKKKIVVYSNMPLGDGFKYSYVYRDTLHDLFLNMSYDPDIINIVILDEIQSYFPKDTKDKIILQFIDQLTGDFSQLRKRQCYVLSTAQVYGRLNKNLREQCLYMVNCRRSFFNRSINEFIPGDDIMCDDLGRWGGVPKFIYSHGLPRCQFDTHALILK